jgi:hypothetical protein
MAKNFLSNGWMTRLPAWMIPALRKAAIKHCFAFGLLALAGLAASPASANSIADLARAIPAWPDFGSALTHTNASARDRALLTLVDAALAARKPVDALPMAKAISHNDQRQIALRKTANGFLELGQMAQAASLLESMAETAAEPAPLHAEAQSFRFMLGLLDHAARNETFDEPLQIAPLKKLPSSVRIAFFTALAHEGYDVDLVLESIKDTVFFESIGRDAALGEIAAGKAIDAELRWRSMALGRNWFHLGVVLYLEARIHEDAELAGEIRSQLLIAASDGLSRFDADISAFMLAFMGQPAEGYAVSEEAKPHVARLLALHVRNKAATTSRIKMDALSVRIEDQLP